VGHSRLKKSRLRDMQPKVADFGVSRVMQQEIDLNMSMAVGTAMYMSPYVFLLFLSSSRLHA